jgi:hypothetical protein
VTLTVDNWDESVLFPLQIARTQETAEVRSEAVKGGARFSPLLLAP